MQAERSYQITISQVAGDRFDESLVRLAIEAALVHFGVREAEIDVAVVDDAEMERLNREHLGHLGPTDVLTFDLRESSDAPIDGQIVLSIDTAHREAGARGHAVDAELALYAVHGVLHLLGYDDAAEADAQTMHALEDQILARAGLGPIFHRPTN